MKGSVIILMLSCGLLSTTREWSIEMCFWAFIAVAIWSLFPILIHSYRFKSDTSIVLANYKTQRKPYMMISCPYHRWWQNRVDFQQVSTKCPKLVMVITTKTYCTPPSYIVWEGGHTLGAHSIGPPHFEIPCITYAYTWIAWQNPNISLPLSCEWGKERVWCHYRCVPIRLQGFLLIAVQAQPLGQERLWCSSYVCVLM